MLRRALCVLVSLCLASHGAAQTQPKATDPEVLKGIRQVEDGDYDAAIVTLEAASRRLTGDSQHLWELSQAFLYTGVAYVGKGHEAAARAKFREALRRAQGLTLSTDQFPPKVIDSFEAAREEVTREAPAAPTPQTSPTAGTGVAPQNGGGSKGLLIAGGVVLAGGGIALAAKGGSKSNSTPTPPPTTTDVFANEVVVFGGGRAFAVTVKASGTLTATVTWDKDGVLLGMYIVNLADVTHVILDGSQTGAKEVSLTTAVTPGSYRISVNNSTGMGPHVNTTFTLKVTHP